ncbi:hypothetical protein GOP47_0016831 [Adiantum capillus-veneris]|uniref:Protein kinase domain-containing protein n=1 Tax=Adiantum capillus-veneris TaxID=13818 RepID=A0A9D4ZDC7_ADICA|nr:hypothetical protein GOP47_0016831 [Adiantum capillus-veneris]
MKGNDSSVTCMGARILHFGYILPLLLCLYTCKGYADLAGDADGLLLFKKSVDVYGVLEWDIGRNVCEWEGVNCTGLSSSSLRVTTVRLPGRALSGRIPNASLGRLAELRVLSLHDNSLSDGLPTDLSNCTFIRSIYLQHNSFSGSLPPDFSSWPNLLHLDLSFNNFSASIPPSLGNLTQLKSIYLQNNFLSGPIPSLNIPSLVNFSVANNQLEGAIPNTTTYSHLAEASFSGNNLCGFPLQPCGVEAPGPFEGNGAAPRKHHRGLSVGAIAGLVVGLCFGLLCVVLLCFTAVKKGSAKDSKKTSKPVTNGSLNASSSDPRAAAYVSSTASNVDYKKLVFLEGVEHRFDLEDLLRASAEVLGKGSIGTSYKAVLESGLVVAVKRLKDVTTERHEFEGHMVGIGRLQHDNLVPLIAYYYSKDEKLLVTEYVPNGSLSALLHGNKGVNHTPLDWDARVRIALGAAIGIDYLHEHMCVHGNIKSSNILLRKKYTSCVSDYGMSELVSASPAANRVMGYRAPEAVDLKRTNAKGDVYSYGVLLLELLTGREPANAAKSGEGLDLPRWVQSVVKEEWSAHVFDDELMKYISGTQEDEMMQMLHIAMSCVAPSPDQRPSMKQVIEFLQGLKKSQTENH